MQPIPKRLNRRLLLLTFVLTIIFGAFLQNGYARGNTDLPAWGQVPSPNAGFHPNNSLYDAVVLSPTNIWAVGGWGDMYSYPFEVTPMIQHWDGTQWTIADLPAELPNSTLYGVDASSESNVWAVGNYQDPAIFRYDGMAWSEQTPLIGTYNWRNFRDVEVLSPDNVWVTGVGQINYTQNFLLLFHWNGSSWDDQSIAFNYGEITEVGGIEAISSTQIWVVGSGNSPNGRVNHLYRFDGTAWEPVTDPVIEQFDEINDISTHPSGEVWLSGYDANFVKQMAYFNGTTWSVIPPPANGSNLYGDAVIQAVAPHTLLATNFYRFNGQDDSLVWQWDGTTWSTSTVVETGTTLFLRGFGASDTERWIVGRNFDNGTLTQRWNGTGWESIASANGGTGDNVLSAVDGTSANDIWATDNIDEQAKVLHWDGSMWEITNTPAITTGLTLEGIDAFAPNDVWSVGWTYVDNLLNYQTVIVRWNGTTWNRVASPNPGGTEVDQLHDVVALSTTDAWAVGETGGTGDNALILRWNGSNWQNVPNSCGRGLASITAISPNDLWAVGEYTTCHYDGTTWTSVGLPPDLEAVRFNGVDGVATDDVWAVGSEVFCQPKGGCISFAVPAHWDGSAWTRFNSAGGQLEDVVTLAPDNAYAVGTNNIGTVIVHWDGTSWSNVPAPDPGSGGLLNGIYAASADSLWAVGSYYDDNSDQHSLVLNAPSATQGAAFGNVGYGGATILWLGPTNGSTTSDSVGDYAAAGLPAGTYTFVATGDGCPVQQATVYITAGQFVRQDFDLCGTQPTQVPSPTATATGATATPTTAPPSATPTTLPPGATPTNVPPSVTPSATLPPDEPTATPTDVPPSATPTVGLPSVTPSPTEPPNEPTATPTESPQEPPVILDPAQVETSQTGGTTTETMVRMTNMDPEVLVWSSYTAESSCSAPSPLSWVSVSPDAGTVAPGAEVMVMVSLDTTDMSTGDYHGYVCILNSAGLIKPLPVILHVIPESGGTRLYLPLVNRE